jgi:hypothetical protein
MKRLEALAINTERFRHWAARLADEIATPILALAIRHGEPAGGLVLLAMEDPEWTPEVLAAALREAADGLCPRPPEGGGRPDQPREGGPDRPD